MLDKAVGLIQDKRIKKWVKNFLNDVTRPYFWVVPASSTGKYHNSGSAGQHGLVFHTKYAIFVAVDLVDNELFDFTTEERDVIIAALILHDTFKYGRKKTKYTVAEHAVIAHEEVLNFDGGLPIEVREKIAECILTHNGKWNTKWNSDEVIAPKPSKKIQKFCHLADYLASRKYIEFDEDKIDI